MPRLEDSVHLEMLKKAPPLNGEIYGMHWADPEALPSLKAVIERYIKPFVNSSKICLEIGPGGGRWTQYLLGFKKIYAVDYHQELIDEFNKNFSVYPNIECIKNDGTNFPGVPKKSVDFLFSFGVFVHLDIDLIDIYLRNMREILHEKSTVFIQYSDKNKPLAKRIGTFSMNTPEIMRRLLANNEYEIIEEENDSLLHSSIVLFKKKSKNYSMLEKGIFLYCFRFHTKIIF